MKMQSAISTPATSGSLRFALHAFFAEYPIPAAILVTLAHILLAVGLGIAAKALVPQWPADYVVTIALSAFVAGELALLGWWKVAGFNAPSAWRNLRFLLIPCLVVFGLPFLQGVQTSDWGTFLYLLIGYALTGFMEEGQMRGVVLHILKPLGVTKSVVISSLLFALLHVTNFLFRNPWIVLAQMVGAFVHGIGLSAIRLRTNTIWFVVILHGVHDLFLKYTNFPAIPLDVVQVTLLMVYGIYLLRSWHEPESAQA